MAADRAGQPLAAVKFHGLLLVAVAVRGSPRADAAL
jgi:hypothetical protein